MIIWSPRDTVVTEARVGGRFVNTMVADDGSWESTMTATIVDFVEPERFTEEPDGSITVDGMAPLRTLNRKLGTEVARLGELFGLTDDQLGVLTSGLDRLKFLDADGKVAAKTGWIKHGYTLAGVITAKDGTKLTFAIYALGNVTDKAKLAIDALATGFYRCGDQLSNQ